MAEFSPKIEIINHFDELINRIDIDIDSSIEKLNDKQLLTELVKSSEYDRTHFRDKYDCFKIAFFSTFDPSKTNLDSWSESTKVTDYLKQIRMRTIEELNKAQEETIEYYKLNSKRFKSEEKSIDQLKNELFANRFYFQVNFKQSERKLWDFNVFTFVTDFYLPPSYIDSFEKLINNQELPFGLEAVFDDKIVLTGLLYEYFSRNLIDLSVPNHVIRVNKQDLLNVVSIGFKHEYSAVNLNNPSTIDLSKLVALRINIIDKTDYHHDWRESVKYNIEGLSSLKILNLKTTNTKEIELSIKNLPSLRYLDLSADTITIDENILTPLLKDQLQHIEVLTLYGNISHFNLDNLSNLKSLSLHGTLLKSFNFELFKNLCNRLEYIMICLKDMGEIEFVKLFDGCNFTHLGTFYLSYLNLPRLTKEFFSPFATLRNLIIICCEIDIIEHDSFSHLKQLCMLTLITNKISRIEENAFLMLENLRTLDLLYNDILSDECVKREYLGLRESVELNIELYSSLIRQILSRF